MGTVLQEGRMDVISAAGSRTSLWLSHAWSSIGPPPPALFPLHQHSNIRVKPALEKPGSQVFRSTALSLGPLNTNTPPLTDVPSNVRHTAGGEGETNRHDTEKTDESEDKEGWR